MAGIEAANLFTVQVLKETADSGISTAVFLYFIKKAAEE
jgi:hypothetical protein